MSEHDEHELSDESEQAELSALRALAPQAAEQVEWLQPPADLWNRIAADAGVSPGPPPGRGPRSRSPSTVAAGGHSRSRSPPQPSWPSSASPCSPADDSADEVAMVAEVQLATLAGGGTGSAELVEHDGHLELHVHTAGLEAGDGYLELWMIDPTVSKLVSLGPLRDDEVYVLPSGVDPAEYPIVDVSAEPVDGNPAHSGASLLRGELEPST